MSEEMQQEQMTEQNQPIELNRSSAIQTLLNIASKTGLVVKGIAEAIKALECHKVQCVFLADDCDNEQYKATLIALAKELNVPVLPLEKWVDLKDYCKLGLPSTTIQEVAKQKGKEPKIKPRCSSCAIIEWGEESEAKNFLASELGI